MEERELLKDYWDNHYGIADRRSFNELTDEELYGISKMWGFAFWKAKRALEQAKKKVANMLPHN